MLGKLFKYENKALAKMLIPLSIGVILLSILTTFLMKLQIYISSSYFDRFDDLTSVFEVGLIILLVFCFIAIISAMFIALVLILQRFRRNLFTDEGYLTFTLPVKTQDILLSKLFSASIWYFIVLISVFIGAIIFAIFGTSYSFINYDVLKAFSEFFEFLAEYTTGAVIAIIIEYLVYMIISIPMQIMLFYLAITLGNQIAKKHKVFAAIGMYFLISAGLSTIQSVIQTMFLIPWLNGEYTGTLNGDLYGYILMLPTIIIAIGAGIAFFFITKYIIKNKLNLE